MKFFVLSTLSITALSVIHLSGIAVSSSGVDVRTAFEPSESAGLSARKLLDVEKLVFTTDAKGALVGASARMVQFVQLLLLLSCCWCNLSGIASFVCSRHAFATRCV